jgi:SAM-dependent methyltransferase
VLAYGCQVPTDADPPADNPPETFDLHDAYAVETPDDNVELYRRWAASYEDDFMASHGYVYHVGVARVFADVAGGDDGPVLDVGCGTGVVASEIGRLGRWPFDGLDISPEMLAQAAEKLNLAGAPVYGSLIQADLTKPLDIETATYGSVVSAGTFTTGHVGPQAIDELARIVRPGGLLVLGVNTRFYDAAGFGSYLEGLASRGVIVEPTYTTIELYERTDHEHAGDRAHVLTLRTVG